MMEYKSYTQYSGAEAWLHATYPHLHAIWKQAIANNDTTVNTDNFCTICKVKPSLAVHYGVKICEADKQFLKRTFHYQLVFWLDLTSLRLCTKKTLEPNPFTFQMTFQPKQEQYPIPENYSFADLPLAFPPPPSFQYYPATISSTQPSFYDIPSFYRTPSPTLDEQEHSNSASFFDREQNLCPKSDKKVSPVFQECTPLDLSVKFQPALDDEQWFTDELTFTEFPTKLLYLQPKEEPLDLSTASSACPSPTKSCFSKPSLLGWDFSRSSLSRPSSADGRIRSTPSPVLEASYGLNKLSVNSALLADALAQVHANISVSTLANLSNVSDILTDSDRS